MTRTGPLAALFAAAALAPVAAPAQTGLYLRGGFGVDEARDTRLRDRDCTSVQPPALFGCGTGSDGRPLSAAGGFGGGIGVEGAVGARLLPALRLEGLLAYRASDFRGDANFVRTPGRQPVSADLESLTGLVAAYLDLPGLSPALRLGPFEPFVGAGIGVTRHDLSRVTFAFPGLGPQATTVIAGGRTTRLTSTLTAGTALRLAPNLTLDLAYRYTDFGTLRTEPGPATITRRTFTRTLDIAGTEAELSTHGVSGSVRVEF